jgi:hypothetical protein
MAEWPQELFIELWKARRGFRCTQSYGRLFALNRKCWNQPSPDELRHLDTAGLYLIPMQGRDWSDLPEEVRRRALAKAMTWGEKLDMGQLQRVGQDLLRPG